VRYSYQVYGLGIRSPSKIEGLSPLPATILTPDISFESASQPGWVTEGKRLPSRLRSRRPDSEELTHATFILTEHGDAQFFHFAYSDGAQFVIDGESRRVWGVVEPPLTSEDLATYFLGPIMGFLLRQRHITSLHASAVNLASRAVAFCGDAGYGKSTTAAALALRGHPVLSEDIVPIREANRQFHAVPGYPRVNLWPDSVAELLGSPDALPQLTPVWEKRYLALDGLQAHFASQELPLGLIYLFSPRSPEPAAPRLEDVQPRIALLELVQNTYMNWLLDRQQRAVEFDTLARLVQSVPIRRIIPSTDPQKINLLCDLILKDAADILSRHGKPSDVVPT
jgi:hypothetical protein